MAEITEKRRLQIAAAAKKRRDEERGGPPRKRQSCPSLQEYRRGCRCDGCTAKNTEHSAKYRKPTDNQETK